MVLVDQMMQSMANVVEAARAVHAVESERVVCIGKSGGVRWIEAEDVDAIVEAVGAALDDLEDRDHAPESMLVATVRSSVRDRLREEFSFIGWEHEDPMAIVCENVHRIKGLEYDHVILVATDPDGEVSDELVYVGASRAVMSLTVIGPAAVGDRLNITDRV